MVATRRSAVLCREWLLSQLMNWCSVPGAAERYFSNLAIRESAVGRKPAVQPRHELHPSLHYSRRMQVVALWFVLLIYPHLPPFLQYLLI